jgi:hypothetical protein
VTLRPIRRLRGRSSRFAGALLRRYGLRPGSVAPVQATLLHAGAQSTHWRVHLHLLQQRTEVRVAPQLTLVLAPSPSAGGVIRGEPHHVRDGAHAFAAPVETVAVRRTLSERELRVVETRAAREAVTVVQRVLARATRLDASPAAVPGRTTAAYAPPRVDLVLARRPVPAAAPDLEVQAAVARAAADAATAAVPGAVRSGTAISAPLTAEVDVERLTDSVLEAIDSRVVARRERLGRL